MKFDKLKFKENSKYMLIILVVLNVILLISFVASKSTSIGVIEHDLEENGESTVNKLVINEVSNNNGGSYSDSEGNIYDWIELYNGTDEDINLYGYSLSDDNNRIKFSFNEQIIKTKEYLVIFLAGEAKEGLYTNFSLSKKGGEIVVLKNTHGKVVDIVETVKTNKNTSMARDLEGEFHVVKNVTPGYINTLEGYKEYISSLEELNDDLIFNEVLVRNGGQFKDSYGEYTGYVELKNNSDKKIHLNEYSMSNDLGNPFKWQLPNKTLDPGELILIYTSGKESNEYYANFKLDSKNGVVILTKNGKITNKLEYENVANGYALSFENGIYVKTGALSGGYNNDIKGIEKFASHNEKTPKSLIISEVMNNNYSYLAQNGGNYYDWIELYNNSNDAVNLSDYYLTTSLNEPDMYQLPDKELSPGEYYIVMASGDSNLSNSSYYHANFKLGNVESLYLTSKNKAIDSMFISNVKTGYSYGRNGDGFIYMDSPTPGSKNNSGRYEVSYLPESSVKAGVYNNVDNVTIELSSPGTIHYTLNGDEPTARSSVYTGPITLTKTTVIRAISVEDGKYNSEIMNESYIINENHTLPVMSVAIDNAKYRKVTNNTWGSTEEAAYAALYDGDEGFEIPCGFKLFGGSTRGLKKQSFALKFKKQYGESELHYQVFDNRDNSVYNTLILRSGSQDYNISMLRDPVLTSLMEDSNVDVQGMRPIILYVNGDYRGIYFIVEKIDEDMVASHYNVSSDNTNLIRVDGEVGIGSGSDYEDILKYMKTHDMTNNDNYEYVKSKFDMDSLLEFWIAETYLTNNDIINCKMFSNPNVDGGKWHFIFFDLDYAMYWPTVNYYTFMNDTSGMGSMKVRADLTYYLFKNGQFRQEFVTKLSEMIKSTWNEGNIISKINEYHDLLEPEMTRNASKWGFTMSSWEKEVESMRNFARRRNSYLLNQTKYYFGLSDSEMSVFYE